MSDPKFWSDLGHAIKDLDSATAEVRRLELEAENLRAGVKQLRAKLVDAEEAYSVIKDAYGELEGTLAAFACIAEASAVQLGLSEEWREARLLVGLEG